MSWQQAVSYQRLQRLLKIHLMRGKIMTKENYTRLLYASTAVLFFFFLLLFITQIYINMASTAAERATLIFNHITKASPSLRDKVCIVTGAGSIYGIG